MINQIQLRCDGNSPQPPVQRNSVCRSEAPISPGKIPAESISTIWHLLQGLDFGELREERIDSAEVPNSMELPLQTPSQAGSQVAGRRSQAHDSRSRHRTNQPHRHGGKKGKLDDRYSVRQGCDSMRIPRLRCGVGWITSEIASEARIDGATASRTMRLMPKRFYSGKPPMP